MSVPPETTPPEKSVEELKAELAKVESEKAGLIGETQELRRSRQEKDTEIATLQAALDAAVRKNNESPEDEKIAKVVQAVFAQRDQQSAKSNLDTAFSQFVAENNEYSPENDASGLKLQALKKEFESFNTSGLSSVSDFASVIGKANALLRGTGTPRQTTDQNPYSSTPSRPAAPSAPVSSKLNEQESKLVAANGWTEDQFLKLKEKYPDMIEGLISPVVH